MIKLRSKRCPTDLSWEEQNPSSYLFDNRAFIRLKKTIKDCEAKEKAKEKNAKANAT